MSGQLEIPTRSGTVRGDTEGNGVRVWRGMPYAAAPVGDLRFRAPQAHAGWAGIRDATAFGKVAPQPSFLGQAPAEPMDEDCLFLNIWSPPTDAPPRPVIVFLHGGGYYMLSGSNPRFNGRNLAVAADVVVVTLNYRLGPLGFLDLSGLPGAEGRFETNLGLRDQLAALAWLKDNIAEFGGDPQNITISGESAGGGSTACLMASPLGRGLFHAAISHSAPIDSVFTPEQAIAATQAFLEFTGSSVNSFDDFAALPIEVLLDAADRLATHWPNVMPGHHGFQPVVDGDVLLDQVTASIKAGIGSPTPLIIGSTQDEGSVFALPGVPPLIPAIAPNAENAVRAIRPDTADFILDAYDGQGRFGQDVSLGGDLMVTMPAVRFAEAVSVHSPVFFFRFAWTSPSFMARGLGSPHTADVPFAFGILDEPGLVDLREENQDDLHRLSSSMQAAWARFLHHRDPADAAGKMWPRYDKSTRATLIFDDEISVQNDPDSGLRQAWDV